MDEHLGDHRIKIKSVVGCINQEILDRFTMHFFLSVHDLWIRKSSNRLYLKQLSRGNPRGAIRPALARLPIHS